MHPIHELAAVLYPLPEPGSVTPDDCFDDARGQIEELRKQYADDLNAAAMGADGEPLILALEQARAQKEAADRCIRLIFAYAREFYPLGRYPLRELGDASGSPVSASTDAYTS